MRKSAANPTIVDPWVDGGVNVNQNMKILKMILIVLAALACGWFVVNWYGWHRMKTGCEINVQDSAPYLRARLHDDFGYSGFEDKWLEKAWVNGWQDHTYLFVVAGETKDLRSAIEKATGGEPIQRAFFSSGNYLGPSTAPAWWDNASLDAAESRYFQKHSNFWRFTWINGRLYIVYCN